MEHGIKKVTRAKEVLSSRGMNVEVRECVPGLESYQLVVRDIQVSEHDKTEKAIETEFGVSTVMVIPDDDNEFAFLGDDNEL